ncbi:H-NS histone family protein [Pseudomonas savastanoi]
MGERPPKGVARYRDPANPFNTWGGRGKRPDWLRKYLDQGRSLSEFETKED